MVAAILLSKNSPVYFVEFLASFFQECSIAHQSCLCTVSLAWIKTSTGPMRAAYCEQSSFTHRSSSTTFHSFSSTECTLVPFSEQTRLLLPHIACESFIQSIHTVCCRNAFLHLCCKLPFLLSKAIWNPPYRARVCILQVCSEDEHESIASTWKRTAYKGTRDTFVCEISFFETPSVEGRSKNGRGVAIEASHDGNVDEEDAKRRRLGRFMDLQQNVRVQRTFCRRVCEFFVEER